ncbi:hypothetical protein [Methylobacterium oryzisoli]|uniref:hypothetical protein n=1 Tax=Methylobacterium oryzisoli TaxID=3385502 RepID=UPI0038917E2B
MHHLLHSFMNDPSWAVALHAAAMPAGLASAGLAAVLLAIWLVRRPARTWSTAAALLGLTVAAVGALTLYRLVPQRIGEGRFAVLAAMRERPHDPWPRPAGHVPLGAFGASETAKGIVEPGGSFSPAFRSFGISVWVVEEGGAISSTSDDVPAGLASARYDHSPEGQPAIVVEAPAYVATWSVVGAAHFRLDLVGRAAPGQHVEVAIRSVGPAGGPLHRIVADGSRLHLDEAWTIESKTSTRLTALGEEGVAGWTRPDATPPSRVASATGWAHARLAGAADSRVVLEVLGNAVPAPPWPVPQVRLSLKRIDPAFAHMLEAQITALLSGVVGDETRPGDPVNYPLQWQRDATFILVALARAGYTDLTKRLARPIAREDFFGGFGSESDAPGLALWALSETATLVNERPFDLALWPDVVRKAALITEMLGTNTEMRRPYSGSIVPDYVGHPDLTLVTGPNRDGLISGRMDWHRPVLFVNAVSFAGLRGAAKIAERLGEFERAAEWTRLAESIKAAWRRVFSAPDRIADAENERTFVSGLWPSEIAEPATFEQRLDARWRRHWTAPDQPAERPLWTYFTLAEAHQWLRLGRQDRVWGVLNYFAAHQPMPGLHTLWEGRREENSFGLWKTARGWVRPPNVNPHYWSAAEMLLLQLAMLATVSNEADSEELIIGMGVPPAWLGQPFAVTGIGTSRGTVDWAWTGREVQVTHAGDPLPVRLGPSFPPGTAVTLRSGP